MYFPYCPSSSIWMLAVCVVFASVLEFRIITMFIGEIPMAEHDSLEPRGTGTIGADHGSTTLGKTKKKDESNQIKPRLTYGNIKDCKYNFNSN